MAPHRQAGGEVAVVAHPAADGVGEGRADEEPSHGASASSQASCRGRVGIQGRAEADDGPHPRWVGCGEAEGHQGAKGMAHHCRLSGAERVEAGEHGTYVVVGPVTAGGGGRATEAQKKVGDDQEVTHRQPRP